MNYLLPERTYDEFPEAESIAFGELLSISLASSTNLYTHGLHRYPAKFIPQIPRWAIREYSEPGDTIVDPFAGSGTTTLEASCQGRHGIGIDSDPLACLIGQAKTTNYDIKRLREVADTVLELSHQDPGALRVPLTGVNNFSHWFSLDAWGALQSIYSAIERVDMSDEERVFFLVAFSSILRAVSNADDQSQKTYVSGTNKKTPPVVLPTLQRRLSRSIAAVEDVSRVLGRATARTICASATDLPLGNAGADLFVSSPPYLDSVDYMYNLMLEYFWLGERLGIKSRSDFNAARKNGIGSKQPALACVALPEPLKDLIDLDLIPDYRRAAVGPYFAGMAKHFQEAARVLKPGARYVLVIGNSRTQAGMLPLHDALTALASEAGFEMEHAFGYRIRRHYMKFPRKGRGGIILMDWVITLRNVGARRSKVRKLPAIDDQLPPDAVAN